MWRGVMPAITTPFTPEGDIDFEFLTRHASHLADAGCTGIVALGSLGEGGTLEPAEKSAVLRALVAAVSGRIPVIAGIGAMSTRAAISLARDAEKSGCRGLMVLPPYVYRGSWPETHAHLAAVMNATPLSCMVYNNPIAYGTDITPSQIELLAAGHENLHAIKESSADVRRITALVRELKSRLAVFVGVDDLIVEGINAGAVGWIAGLVNAFPSESVRLFNLALDGKAAQAAAIYRWFLPLLRMDVVPQFVHLIKLAQQEVGWGNERLRPPRLMLDDAERAEALRVIRACIAARDTINA